MATPHQKKLIKGLWERWGELDDEGTELFRKIYVEGNKDPEIQKQYKQNERENNKVFIAFVKVFSEAYPAQKPDIKADLMGHTTS